MDFKNKSLRDNFSKMSNVEKEQKHITFIKSYTKNIPNNNYFMLYIN